MKKELIKRSAIILIAVAILLSSSIVSLGANNVPETVRVGLYFKDNSVNTAQSIFDISAKAGVQIGFFSNDSFSEILSEPVSSTVYIRKDTYYYDSGNGMKEYEPSSSKPTGTKYGPYHVKIGNDLPNAESAAKQAKNYKNAGIHTFVVYADAWQIWAGSYESETTAKNDISVIQSALGNVGFNVVAPEFGRIVASDSKQNILCIFGGSSGFFRIKPAPGNDPKVINIKGQPFRGAVEVKRLSNSDMTVINVVSIREYLYGNVPPEIGGKSPAEALKAQAIASKMYVINNMGKHGKTGFDICATTSCQVYRGYRVEIPTCNHAIDEVSDKIITYGGSPAKHIYYFASGGGSTEDVNNVWGSNYPYLVSVEDKYEKIFNWTKTLRASDVKSKLPQLGNVLGISIVRTAKTGRVTQLAVTGASRGEPAYYSNEKCRTLFGLNSQLYTITTDADVFAAGLSYIWKDSAPLVSDASAASSTSSSSDVIDATVASASTDTSGKVDGAVTGATQSQTPDISSPSKTLLGGKKVITSSGVKTLNGSNKKITIIGAGGNVKKTPLIPETYTFTGKGWGHAVGMSQEGAIGMGKAGLTYDKILTHYFQGTKVE